jgi:hypothetical protein
MLYRGDIAIVIGYSFRDTSINNAFWIGCIQNQHQAFFIVAFLGTDFK